MYDPSSERSVIGTPILELKCRARAVNTSEPSALAKWLLEFLGIPRIFLGIKV